VEGTQSDPSVLVVGLNPGEGRILAGKIAMFASAILLLLSLIQGTNALILFGVAFLLSIVLTCGQQYVLDSSTDVLKKRRLHFLRPTDWTELGKLSDINVVK
jgi:hypothetical protein